MKILLTGPTGFIGSAFTKLALNRGHKIAGLVIPTESIPKDLPTSEELTWLRGTLDETPWAQVERFGPDVCIHTAWVTAPGVYLESPDNILFLESSVKFLQKAVQLGTKHIISLGTCIEYQITNERLSEQTSPILPTTTYARCKNELRLALEADSHAGKFSFCWARVFYPYGPREHPSRLCSSLIQKLSREENIVLRTPESTKDYIFIEDLASALLKVTESRFAGTINLGTGIGVTVREIARTLGNLMGRPELIGESRTSEDDPLGYVVADAQRLHRLGWNADHSLSAGLEALIKFNNFQTHQQKPRDLLT